MKRMSADALTCLRPSKLFSLRAPLLAIACAIAVPSIGAQTAHHPAAPHRLKKNGGAPSKKSVGPIPERPPIVLQLGLPPVLSPEKMPPKVPQVVWDGKLLSIDSENSTLADILIAVKTQTGADLDIPPNASRERVAARLGPGPAREVLSTLLGGTDFDYVIQASDGDPDGVQSVLLTPRGKTDSTVARGGSGSAGESLGRSAYRSVARGNVDAEEVPVAETTASAPPESTKEPAAANAQALSSDATATSDAKPAAAEAAAASEGKPAAVAEGPAGSAAPATASGESQTSAADVAAAPAPSSDASSSTAPVSETERKIQQMQDLFEQRKQMIQDARKPPAN